HLVARVNLTRVRGHHFHSAELGYRVAQDHGGKGYATEAVRLALDYAFVRLRLHRVEAAVRVGNEASAKVLLRNGFVQIGHSSQSFWLEWPVARRASLRTARCLTTRSSRLRIGAQTTWQVQLSMCFTPRCGAA